MTRKRILFALVTVVLIVGVAEGILWVAGVSTLLDDRDPFRGFSESVRVFELDEQRGVYFTPRRALRHSFNYQQFQAVKPQAGFRLFVLGGSTAAGFPWGADVAFTRALGQALQASWPERIVEAVNAAAMSYGSHRLRILSSELLRYEPDVLVIYGGHNEFVERDFYRDMLEGPGKLDGLRRLLYRSRIYSLLTRSYEALSSKRGGDAPEPGEATTGELLGLDVSREHAVDVDDSERAEVTALFEANIGAIVDAARARGVAVVLCTVPSNLRSWLPNQSVFGAEVGSEQRQVALNLLERATDRLEQGDVEDALVALEQARELAPRYAGIRYQLGQAYAALGRWEEARTEFVLARDTDSKPSRAPSSINDAIRRVAEEQGVTLVDVDRLFGELAEHGIPGFDLFEDYVHLKPHAHHRVAQELWQQFEPGDAAFFEQAVGAPVEVGTSAGPEATVEARTPRMLFNLGVVLENQGLAEEAIEKYRACLRLDPSHPAARYNVARLLTRSGDAEQALAEYRSVLEYEPGHYKSWIGIGEAMRAQRRPGGAERALRQAIEIQPGSAHAWSSLGAVLVDQNRQADAEQAFREASRLDPRNVDNRVNLGLTLLFQKKLDEAEAAFRASLELQPQHRPGSNGLAAVLTERGQLDEAERIFRESLRLDPQDTFATGGLALIERRK